MVRATARRRRTVGRLFGLSASALLVASLAAPVPTAAAPPVERSDKAPAARPAAEPATPDRGRSSWTRVQGKLSATRDGRRASVQARELAAYRLDRDAMERRLAAAPKERVGVRSPGITLELPDPTGRFQRFAIEESPVMEPALAARHPDIRTYRGRGLDDATATIRADLTPLGFHASVRSQHGAWYLDPYYHLDQSVYASYYGRSVPREVTEPFVERDADAAELSVDRGYYHAANTVTLAGSGFAADAEITIEISDPLEQFSTRKLTATSDGLGEFEAEFVADPNGVLGAHIVSATDGGALASTSYEVVRDDDPTSDPPTGDVLRTYRLALITDPSYSNYFGGPANVTAAKVTLVNRVTGLYEEDLSIRLILVGNNDLLNLDTYDKAIGPNGPCGTAGCFTLAQVSNCSTGRNRIVIGQIIGAANYDVGHLALGQPGGGVANLGVVGRNNKAGGCTGLATPVGDFFAVDYVAHEVGHQFSGNHTFNGNQLNCSGGNRSQAHSVEPGSGSSIQAYAGICLTDDLQAHSDPYFSQRSLQEMSTYTSSTQAAINEVQTVSLRHFGGGNEVQVATFGAGYAPTAPIMPITLAINAAPGATSRGGAMQVGNTVTIATGAVHRLEPGDAVTIAGVAVAGYNGTFTVTSVPNTRAFTYENPVGGLARSGGGTVTVLDPGARQVGNTVTIRTALPHGRAVGDVVTLTGINVAAYNGAWTITAVTGPRTFEFSHPTAGLANGGGGTMTFFSPFQVRIGGSDSAVIGGSGLPYSTANLQTAINAIPGFPGNVTVSGAAAAGFTLTFDGASAGLDVPSVQVVNLACGGCFASVEETNHGGAFDSFTLAFNGNVSAPIVNGTNYTAAAVLAALTPILPAGATATVAGFGGGTFNNTGFQVTFGGSLATTNLAMLTLQDFTPGASAWVGETDKGGAVDNQGGTVTPTGNTWPAVTVPGEVSIPIRTPFVLTGSAVDAESDPMRFIWEQNDRGAAAGTSLLSNTKTNGPLFAMFPKSGVISETDTLLYNSPGQNHITTSPTRVFPDLQQVLDNNTNAETGACPEGPIAPPVPVPVKECFAEFLPTADYVGFAGVNASPLSLNFRFTARDGLGGVNAADTRVLLTSAAGPFLVTTPNTPAPRAGNSSLTVTWDVANTNVAPISAANVRITLSTDGGQTWPHVLAASTSNDGSEAVIVPNVATTRARVRIEAVGNIFFDVSNADFTIQAAPVVTNSLGGGTAAVQYSDALSPAVTVTATDADTPGSGLTGVAAGLPAGLSLAISSTSSGSTLPGSRTWSVVGNVTAAPGLYPVTVTVTDPTGVSSTTSFTIQVTPENAEATYTGDMLAFAPSGATSASVVLRATIRDSAVVAGSGDTAAGNINNATVTFREGATTLCGPVPVAGLNGSTTTGTASCVATLGLGAHTVTVQAGAYYTGSTLVLVQVSTQDGSFVTGGGTLLMTAPAGTYGADTDSILHFAINAKFANNPKQVQGQANLRFERAGHSYELRSTTVDSLGLTFRTAGGAACTGPASATCLGIADFRSRANLVDVTNPASPTTVATNLTLQITVTDRGDPGTADSLGATAWGGTTLVFSSHWTGTRTIERPLSGGSISVH